MLTYAEESNVKSMLKILCPENLRIDLPQTVPVYKNNSDVTVDGISSK